MAKARNLTQATLFCLLVATACAEGTPSITDKDLLEGSAGMTSGSGGAQAQAGGSAGAGVTAGSSASDVGGFFNAGGSPSAGSSSGGAPITGGAPGSATAGASAMGGTSAGGNATAGASSAGRGGTSAGGGASSMAGGSSAGSGGAAACTSTKPESSCVCHSRNNHDYWFCPTLRIFADAESKCVGAGMHLVKIVTASQDQWVNEIANAASFGEYYLGSTDASTPNTWTWLAGGTFWTGVADGTASGYANWGGGEPNASGDCLVVQNNFVWDDRSCTDTRTYICD
jgi:hypothetical protein